MRRVSTRNIAELETIFQEIYWDGFNGINGTARETATLKSVADDLSFLATALEELEDFDGVTEEDDEVFTDQKISDFAEEIAELFYLLGESMARLRSKQEASRTER